MIPSGPGARRWHYARIPRQRLLLGCGFTSKYMFNHLSAFAHGHDTFAKALFMGGVTKRFPGLNFIFLEGGVAWACNLYSDIIGHWEKRNALVIGRLDPGISTRRCCWTLVREYGEEIMQSKIDKIREMYATPIPTLPSWTTGLTSPWRTSKRCWTCS